MSKLPAFDAAALCAEVHKQDIGLQVQTNDPATFRRKLYEYMAKFPAHKLKILSGPTPSTFLLVKPSYLADTDTVPENT